MNGYPYPVLTDVDSSYKDDIHFKINFSKYECLENKVKLHIAVDLNSSYLIEQLSCGNAELVVKAISDIRSMIFKKEFNEKIEIEIDGENVRANDTIKLTAFVLVKTPFSLEINEDIKDYFGQDYSINLRKGDVLAISNDEKLNYNTTNNDFIKITSSADRDGAGLKIRLNNDNHIEVLVGNEFKHAYATIKGQRYAPMVAPILNSHIVFEAIVYTLTEIAQKREDYGQKEWYRLFSQAFLSTGETIEEFIEKAYDDSVDMAYVFEMAQLMISNSLETSVINVSKMGDR